MPWVRLDDKLPDHLKFVGIDLTTMGLWSLTLIDSARRLTDGFVPASEPRRYGATKRHVAELIRRELWEPVDGGWLIHDFHDYQPSAESVRRQRDELSKTRAEAGRKGAEKRWQPDGTSHGKPDGKPDGNGHGNGMAPSPVSPLVTSVGQSSSVDARAIDDDDGGNGSNEALTERLMDALDQVGRRRHNRAEQAGRLTGNPAKHLEACIANARAELVEPALQHLAAHPDATTADLVEHLDPATLRHPSGHRLALVPGPPPNPTCGHCGGKHIPIPGGCTLPPADPEVDP